MKVDLFSLIGGSQKVSARDCRHAGAPGCAVRKAIEKGDLDASRLESYHKLQREQEFQRRKTDRLAAQERKSIIKKTNREVRRLYRERDDPTAHRRGNKYAPDGEG